MKMVKQPHGDAKTARLEERKEGLLPTASSRHVREPSWKWILQPSTVLHLTANPATQVMKGPKQTLLLDPLSREGDQLLLLFYTTE